MYKLVAAAWIKTDTPPAKKKKTQIVLEYFIGLQHNICNERFAYCILSNRRTVPEDESKYAGLI